MQEKEHNSLNMFPELIREKKANRFRVFYMYVSIYIYNNIPIIWTISFQD